LIQWKPWARRTLIAWALGDIVLSFVSTAFWFVDYANTMSRQTATTRALSPSLAFQGWTSLLSCASNAAFPLSVLVILMQPEIKKLWALRRGGGFEVVPLARTAAVPQPAAGGSL
jgi:hypothetical protein